MQKVKREELLNQLESIRPGLSPREIMEQSSCFVFRDGRVMTYNDEIACSQNSCLDLEGAVQAAQLMAILSRLPTEFVDIVVSDSELVIQAGKSRETGIRMEKDILLPIDSVEQPSSWKTLPDDYADAIYIVMQCAGTDESKFVITCVHLHPQWVEACDNYQLSRYPIKTGVKRSCLVRAHSIKHIVELGMTEFAETATWVHYRNPTGLVLSCRKSLSEYPDLESLLDVSGSPATLPKGLAEATSNAQIFSSENADNDNVLINLSPKGGGRLRVTGDGASGWYKESKRLKYAGKPMKFRIAPKLLIELTKRHNECEIAPDRLLVNGSKFKYVTCLGVADE